MNSVFLSELKKFCCYPLHFQVFVVSLSWLVFVFILDAWFSPFYLYGYKLISYTLIALVFSAWIAHFSVHKLVQITTPLPITVSNNQIKSCNFTLRDISERELEKLSKVVANTVVDYWSDDSNDNTEFVKEIQHQFQEFFVSLSEKLSKISVQSYLKGVLSILHNHIRNYLKTQNTQFLLKNSNFPCLHPVTRGEISVDLYLNCFSQAVMKEFIPGCIQDCSAIFDISCAALYSQILMRMVQHISQPELILQSLLKILDTESENHTSGFVGSDTVLLGASQNPSKNNFSKSDLENSCSDQLCDKTPHLNDEIPFAQNSQSYSPIINPLSNCSDDSDFFSCLSQFDETSYVETGLRRTIPTAAALLLSSQSTKDLSQPHTQGLRKPDSLPLKTSNVDKNESVDRPVNPLSSDAEVSPVYEDVEDFATAIAKLRSLLEQRNTSSESAGSKGSFFSPTSDNTRIGSASGETEGSFEELVEASEQQLDSRIFLNIKIPRTEVCSVPSEGQHSVYCICYDGIYSAISTNPDEGQREPRLVLKTRTVRRRFRQFLELHSRLANNDDPNIVRSIGNIRGPSKWQNLPFSRLDQNTVAYRQGFLERYLQDLILSPTIGVSTELRHFLEYDLHLNENTATSSTAALQRVPFFVKTMSGVLQSLKTALPLTIPGFENDQNRGVQLVPLPPPSPHSVTFDSNAELKCNMSPPSDKGGDSLSACQISYSIEESNLEQMLSKWIRIDCRVESALEAYESIPPPISSPLQDLSSAKSEEYRSCLSLCDPLTLKGWDRFDEELPFSSSVINLAVECLGFRGTWLTRAPVALIIKVLFGRQIETNLQEALSSLANPDRLSENFQEFLKKIDQADGSYTFAECSNSSQTIDQLVMSIVEQLESMLPRFAVLILGKNLSNDVLRMIVSCFKDVQLNQDLALTLLDFTFSLLSSK